MTRTRLHILVGLGMFYALLAVCLAAVGKNLRRGTEPKIAFDHMAVLVIMAIPAGLLIGKLIKWNGGDRHMGDFFCVVVLALVAIASYLGHAGLGYGGESPAFWLPGLSLALGSLTFALAIPVFREEPPGFWEPLSREAVEPQAE